MYPVFNNIDKELYNKNYISAIGYHTRAIEFLKKNKRASLVFNIAAVSVEYYLLTICSIYDIMPFSHSYNCLMNTVTGFLYMENSLETDIRSLDEIFGICSVDNYHHGTPDESDMHKTLNICDGLRQIIEKFNI